ncbi:MAG: hypothetical protein JOY61_20000, partial [Chloroflexi bacterium]|nr:hypothetical protein [Chloroflexota bacterium]
AVASATPSVPRYDHIFVIVEENHSFTDVIGNPAAPNLNALANQFGLATNYFGVTHPSEPNYVALLGGNLFGINSDDAYFVRRSPARRSGTPATTRSRSSTTKATTTPVVAIPIPAAARLLPSW